MKVLKTLLIAAAVLVVLVIGGVFLLLTVLNSRNATYWEYTQTGGEIEARYTALGPCEVSYMEFDAKKESWQKFEVWYPSDMKDSGADWPLVIMANGTGVKASQYKEVLQHLAS